MKSILFVCVWFSCLLGMAQLPGGNSVFSFLNVAETAKSAGSGGSVLSQRNDLQFITDNPALLTSELDNGLSLSYINFVSDINFGNATFVKNFEKVGVFAAELTYVNYGDFIAANSFGEVEGAFTAADYNLSIVHSRPLNEYFNIGFSLNNTFSVMETYSSFGVGADVGVDYLSDNKSFGMGVVVSNIGRQLKTYGNELRESYPFNMQFGLSKKLGHAPFRFNVLADNLQKWDLTYQIEEEDEESSDKLITFDKFMRHMVLGVDLVPNDNFYISLSYNYRRRQELKLSSKGGMIGFSIGAGLKLKKFGISFARSVYQFSGASNHLTLVTNLSNFTKTAASKD